MKKIIPFKKEIKLKTPIHEVTSISLEHTLHIENSHLINGEFIITGDYRITETSTNTENFNFNLPIDIDIDEKYIIDSAKIDIEDFYYEILNNDTLLVTIETKIDHLIEQPLIEKDDTIEILEISDAPEIEKDNSIETLEIVDVPRKEDKDMIREIEDLEVAVKEPEVIIERETKVVEAFDTKEEVKSLFSNMDLASETYATYKICIVREGETLENIMTKYGITRDILELYNDLKEIKIGDKIIIPNAKD